MQVFAPCQPYKTGSALLKAGGSEGGREAADVCPQRGAAGVEVWNLIGRE